MDELLGLGRETAEHVDFLLDEVFDSLHIVVGGLLNLLHAGSILLSKVAIDVAQGFEQTLVEACQLWQRQFAERNKVFDFHPDTIADKCILRKVSCQLVSFAPVTAINRRDGCQYVQFHCCLFTLNINI